MSQGTKTTLMVIAGSVIFLAFAVTVVLMILPPGATEGPTSPDIASVTPAVRPGSDESDPSPALPEVDSTEPSERDKSKPAPRISPRPKPVNVDPDDLKAALAVVVQLGARVTEISQDDHTLEIDFHLEGRQISDDDLVHLSKIPNIVRLNLANTKVTGSGLRHISHMQSLTHLYLQNSDITDDGLKHLESLGGLSYINLYKAPVTNDGLRHLKKIRSLRKVYLWESKVTESGAKELAASLPRAVIHLEDVVTPD